jgi:hypothetical protein
MIDCLAQKHSIGLSHQAQRGVSLFLTVNQGCQPKPIKAGTMSLKNRRTSDRALAEQGEGSTRALEIHHFVWGDALHWISPPAFAGVEMTHGLTQAIAGCIWMIGVI